MSDRAPLMGSGNGGTSASTFQGVSFDARPVRDNNFRICYLALAAISVVSVGIAGATANFKGHNDYVDSHKKWVEANNQPSPFDPNPDNNDTKETTDSVELSTKNSEILLGLIFAFIVGAFGAGFLWMRFLVAHARAMTWFSVGVLVGSLWLSALSLLFSGVFVGFVVMAVIAALLTGFVYWRRNTIDLTAELLRNASRALLDHKAVVWANLGLILFGFFTLVFAVSGFYFASITGEAHQDTISGEPIWKPASYASGLQSAIGLGFTFTQFLLATCSTFLTAGVTALWYFHRDDLNRMPAAPVSKVMSAAVGPQLGTLAFSALILWVIEVLRDAQRNAKKKAKNNAAILCLLCLLSMIENLIEFISMFAVIYASITGAAFMDSAKTSWEMFKRRGIDMVTVDSFGSLVLNMTAFFASVFMGLAAALCGHVLMDSPPTWAVVVLGIVVFIASLIVFIPYIKMALASVDTCFCCYVIDMDCAREDVGNNELKAVLDEKLSTRK